ncbi:MAG: hypothetical protein ACI9S8_000617 [Chlamydiales bacterium]|jgi:hypothetical protein
MSINPQDINSPKNTPLVPPQGGTQNSPQAPREVSFSGRSWTWLDRNKWSIASVVLNVATATFAFLKDESQGRNSATNIGLTVAETVTILLALALKEKNIQVVRHDISSDVQQIASHTSPDDPALSSLAQNGKRGILEIENLGLVTGAMSVGGSLLSHVEGMGNIPKILTTTGVLLTSLFYGGGNLMLENKLGSADNSRRGAAIADIKKILLEALGKLLQEVINYEIKKVEDSQTGQADPASVPASLGVVEDDVLSELEDSIKAIAEKAITEEDILSTKIRRENEGFSIFGPPGGKIERLKELIENVQKTRGEISREQNPEIRSRLACELMDLVNQFQSDFQLKIA